MSVVMSMSDDGMDILKVKLALFFNVGIAFV